MTTDTVAPPRTTRKASKPIETATPAAEQPARPAIWLQVILPSGGATQPAAIPLDVPEWERMFDQIVINIKLAVMRDMLESLKAPLGIQ